MLQWLYLLIIYPMYTFWFASHASILEENLSYVGNLTHLHGFFILWGILTIYALAIGLRSCLQHSIFKQQYEKMSLLSACLLVVAVTLPYQPNTYPLLSFLHILLSFAAPLSLLAMVFVLLNDLRMLYPKMKVYLTIFSIICVIALGIYFTYASVNSFVEIFLAISLSVLLKFAAMQLAKE